jgi:hypothetical protein
VATLRTVIVDKDEAYSGWDYSTLNSAESNEQGDISLTTGTDEYVVFECYATSGTADTSKTTFVGWTTQSGNYIQIITPESHRHEGSWDISTYRYEITDYGGSAFSIQENYVRIEGLQIRTPSVNSDYDYVVVFSGLDVANDIRIEKCILRGADSGSYIQYGISVVDTDAIVKIGNNIVYDIENGGSNVNPCVYSTGTSYVYNNTFIGGYCGISDGSSALMTAINNICQDAGVRSFYDQMNANSGYSVVEEADTNTAHGTTHKTGTVTSASTGKLVDSGGGLSSIPIGAVVKDASDLTYSYVTAIDSDTQLSLNNDIFDLGNENYSIYTNKVGTVNFDGSTYLLDSKDDVAIFKGTNLYADSNFPITDDVLENSRGSSSTDFFDIGAHHSLEYAKVVDPDSGTGYDYTSLNTWNSNEQADLQVSGLNKISVATCRCTGGTADTAALTLSGWTTAIAGYIKIWTDPSESYRCFGVYTTGNYYRYEITDRGYSAFEIYENYVRIEGLQIYAVSINSTHDYVITIDSIDIGGSDIRIEKCIIRGSNDGTYNQIGIASGDSDADLMISNNIIYDINTTIAINYGIYIAGTGYVYNNTIIGGYYSLVESGTGQVTAINNICQDAGNRSIDNQMHADTGYNIVQSATTNEAFGTTQKTGTVTSASSGKLVDSGGGLSGIKIGSVVADTTDNTYTYVTAVDSDTQLSINSDIFDLGTENYSIFTNKVGTVTFNGSTYLLASSDTVAIDEGTDLSSDGNYPITDDILSYTRPYNSVWDIGAHEFAAINLAGTISPVTNISGVTLYRIMNLSDTISAVFSTSGVTLYRIMDLTGTVDTISSLTCSELTIIYVLNATSGGLAWGEESPTQGEVGSPWSVWSDGAGGTPTITGDQDWGILSIDTDDEGRSNVYDYGNSVSRTYTLTLNRYGSGSGSPIVQIRGQNTTFNQDDVSPSWETYSTPVAKTWRYVQVRIDYA